RIVRSAACPGRFRRGRHRPAAPGDVPDAGVLGRVLPPVLDGPFAHATQAALRAHTPTLLVPRQASELRRLGTRFFLSTGRSGHGDVKARWTFEFAGELARLRLAHKLWVLPDAKRGHLFREQLPAAIDYASPAT